MCAVSAITDYYREKWPLPRYPDVPQWVEIPKKDWEDYEELKRRMHIYDKDTGQPNCVKPDVDKWEDGVKSYVKG